MNFTRTVEGDDVTLIGVPGYFNRDFVYADDGCVYDAKSLRRLKLLTHKKKKKRRKQKKAAKPVVLISHGPPMGDGDAGIDRVYENQNVGDPALGNTMKRLKIRFGIFGHILESAGRLFLRQCLVLLVHCPRNHLPGTVRQLLFPDQPRISL